MKATEDGYGRPPAEGERSALIGFVPQYEVAAGLALRALTDETLEWIALLDPEAGRLDDFQLATPGRLDAYQIKWSGAGGQMNWSEINANLGDLLRDREGLVADNGDRRVYGHLYTDQVASSARFHKQHEGAESASPAKAVAELLGPKRLARLGALDDPRRGRRGLARARRPRRVARAREDPWWEVRIVWEVERDFIASGQSQRRALRGVRPPRGERTAEPGAASP